MAQPQGPDRPAGIGVAPRPFICSLQDQETDIRRERDRIAGGEHTAGRQSGTVTQNLGNLQNTISAALTFAEQKAPVELSKRDAYTEALRQAGQAASRVVNAGNVPPRQALSATDDVLRALDRLRQVAAEDAPPPHC